MRRVHQVDCGDLIRCSWGCWEKFPFLFFVHIAPGVQLWIGPASACRLPEGVCFHPDRMGLKEKLIRGLWLTQAGGREGYGMWGEPVAVEAGATLQQPEVCHAFSQGNCPWITGPWQWWAAQAPRVGFGEWPVLAHRLLGGCSSSLSVSCPSLVSMLIATAHARLWSSFRRCSECPLLAQPETMVSCLLDSSRLFPRTPSWLAVAH